jgi:capsular polysaccharide biosynthesis protein
MGKQNEDNEIDLLELFFELLNHWKVILLAAILAGALAFGYANFFITPKYEATSQLYVLVKSTAITSLSDIQMGTQLTDDYIVVVNSSPVLEMVIENLDLNETYESLVKRVSVENPSDSRILKITVQDASQSMAVRISEEVADVASEFIAEKMDQEPPTIIQYGYSTGQPVSPNVKKITVIGVMLGACLAVAVVVLLSLLNDSIKTADDVEKKLGLNLIGTYPLESEEVESGNKKKLRKKELA